MNRMSHIIGHAKGMGPVLEEDDVPFEKAVKSFSDKETNSIGDNEQEE